LTIPLALSDGGQPGKRILTNGDQRELTTHTISLQKKPDPSRPHQSFAAATVIWWPSRWQVPVPAARWRLVNIANTILASRKEASRKE
jgi:hypothetical protein